MKYKIIERDGLKGIADEQDNIIIPCIYSYIKMNFFEETELIEVKDKNNLWGVINIKNEILIPCIYYNILINNIEKEILIEVRDKNGLYGVINIKNEILISFKYEFITIYDKIIRCYLGNYRPTHYFIKNNKILIYNKKIYAV